MEAIVDLVGDQVVVVVESGEHREAFDVHGLHREADAEVQDDGEHDDLGQLAKERSAGCRAWLVGRYSGVLRGRHEIQETSLP